MLKLGIVSVAQLRRPRSLLGRQRQASLLLLRELARDPAAGGSHAVMNHVLTANGTWKDTAPERLACLDAETLDVLAGRVAAGTPLAVLDVGASSGVTSIRLFDVLRRRYEVRMLATDVMREVLAVRAPAGWTVVFDAAGRPLQYVLGPFVLQGQGDESALYPVNRVLRRLAQRRFLAQATDVLQRVDASAIADFATVAADGFEITKLPLLAVDALRMLAREPNFCFETSSVLEPIAHRADVVRAMNVLTPAYFDAPRLRIGIRNCMVALNCGGLLILGRSPTEYPRDVRATIYADDHGTLHAVSRLNGGYEADELVLSEWAGLRRAPVPQRRAS